MKMNKLDRVYRRNLHDQYASQFDDLDVNDITDDGEQINNQGGGGTGGQQSQEQEEETTGRLEELESKSEEELTNEERLELKKLKEDSSDDSDDDEDNNEDDNQGSDDWTEEEMQGRLDELNEKGDDLTDEEKQEKAELEDELKPLVFKVRDSYGYDELSDREYSNDDEGFKQLARDVAQIEVKANLEKLHEANPMLAEFYDHVVNKGLSEELFAFERTKQDYEDFNIKEEDGQQKMLSFFYKQQGLGDDEANALIENFKNQGILDKKAGEAKGKLDEFKKQQVETAKQQELQQIEDQKKQAAQIQENLNNIFKTRKIGNLEIPKEEVKDFQDFIYGADEEGNPKRVLAHHKLPLEKKVLIDYIIFKDFKVKGLEKLGEEVKRITFNNDKKNNDSRRQRTFTRRGSKQKTEPQEVSLSDFNIDLSKQD